MFEPSEIRIDRILEECNRLLIHVETALVDFQRPVDVAIVVSHRRGEPVANQLNHIDKVHPVHAVCEMLGVMTVFCIVMVERQFKPFQILFVFKRAIGASLEFLSILIEKRFF